jgi:hypothetical protein
VTSPILELTPEHALGATRLIDPHDRAIAGAAQRIAGAATDEVDAARRLFEFVRDEIDYDMGAEVHAAEDWSPRRTLDRGSGFCQQKAVLLSSLLRARGIPAGVSVQDLRDHKLPARYAEFIPDQTLPFHGLSAAYLGGSWRRLDATLPRSLCERKGYRLVELDGDGDCLLPASDRSGRPHFDFLLERGTWADLPEEIIEATLGLDFFADPRYRVLARGLVTPAAPTNPTREEIGDARLS